MKLEFHNVNIEHIALNKTQNCSTYTKYAACTYIQNGPTPRSRHASSMVIAFSFVFRLNHKPTLISGAATRRRPRHDGRIVGGQAVNIEDFPYQVKMWHLQRNIAYWNVNTSHMLLEHFLVYSLSFVGVSRKHNSMKSGYQPQSQNKPGRPESVFLLSHFNTCPAWVALNVYRLQKTEQRNLQQQTDEYALKKNLYCIKRAISATQARDLSLL